MCGIVGIIKEAPAEQNRGLVSHMAATLAHRGPDGWGRYAQDNFALAHTRLAIIDLSSGQQPMIRPQSVISFNGEIFNYLELRHELEALGRIFLTSSDTEVAQQALEEWGTAAISKFNGQFAILFLDKLTRRLLAIRDRYGMLPLYYLQRPGSAFFASEMKAFDVIPGFSRSWEPQALLMHGLFWNSLDESTVFKDIKSLEPGSYAYFNAQGEKIDADFYYRLGATPPSLPSNYQEAQEGLRAELQRAVDLRLRSDVPVGCYLSGGIDSSITSLLTRNRKGNSFKTFSIGFSDEAFDESIFQDLMVSSLGSQHAREMVSAETINENFLEAAWHFERPVFRTAPLPLYMLSKRVRAEGIKVVLTGEGADEILCGYDVFKEVKLLESWEKGLSDVDIDRVIASLYPHLAHYKDSSQLGFMKMYYEGFLGKMGGAAAGLTIRLKNNSIIEKYLNPDWSVRINEERIEAALVKMTPREVRAWPLLKRNQYLEMRTLMEGYLLSSQGDRMSMGHGVEGRYPFLDHEFVEFAMALPHEWKLNGYRQKAILSDSYRGLVPEKILNRPKQPYQAPDLKAFLPGGIPTDTAAHFLSPDIVRDFGIFSPRMVERMLFKNKRRVDEGIGYRDNMLISFILSAQMIEHWIREPQKGILREIDLMVDGGAES